MAIGKSEIEIRNEELSKTICCYGSKISRLEVAMAIIVLIFWTIFFLTGLFTPTKTMRDEIMFGEKLSNAKRIGYFIQSFIRNEHALIFFFASLCIAHNLLPFQVFSGPFVFCRTPFLQKYTAGHTGAGQSELPSVSTTKWPSIRSTV